MAVAGTAKSAAPTTDALWARPETPTPPSSAASRAATAPPSAEPMPPTIWVTNSTLRVWRWAPAGTWCKSTRSGPPGNRSDIVIAGTTPAGLGNQAR